MSPGRMAVPKDYVGKAEVFIGFIIIFVVRTDGDATGRANDDTIIAGTTIAHKSDQSQARYDNSQYIKHDTTTISTQKT